MVKALTQLEDGENIYKIGDKVRIKMESENPERANEYIGTIKNIHEHFIILDSGCMTRNIEVNKIDRIRFARDGESFDNTWNFDD